MLEGCFYSSKAGRRRGGNPPASPKPKRRQRTGANGTPYTIHITSEFMIMATFTRSCHLLIGTASKPIMPDDINVSLTGASYDEEPYAVDLQRSLVASSKDRDYSNNQRAGFGALRTIGVLSSFLRRRRPRPRRHPPARRRRHRCRRRCRRRCRPQK